MSSILVCTIMRDMVEHPNWEGVGSPLEMYFAQLEALMSRHEVRVSIYENDSSDGTPERVRVWAEGKSVTLVSEKLNSPDYKGKFVLQSTKEELVDRFARYAGFRNRPFELLGDEEWLLLVDPDVIYPVELIDYLLSGPGDIRSSLSFSHWLDLSSFYDPLSTRDLEGKCFRWAWPPANREEDMIACIRGIPFEVSSTWNCLLLVRADLVRQGLRFRTPAWGDNEPSTFCQDARALGAKVYVYPATRLSVYHPLELARKLNGSSRIDRVQERG